MSYTSPAARPPLAVAVIGAGFVGSAHVEAIRRTGLAEVYAVAGSTTASAQAAAERLSVPRATGSFEDVVADPAVDVVHNCTPNHLHAEVATAVLEAGKHLVTEKPLALDTRETAALRDLGARAGVVSAVCQNYRHFAMVQEARRLIADGAICAVHMAHGSYLQDWLCDPGVRNWRLDGERGGRSTAFADIGTHWCDLVAHILDDEIAAVTGRLGALGDRTADDHGAVTLEFRRSGLAALAVSQVSPGRKNRLCFQIDGADGSIAWNQERPDELWIGRPGRASEEVRKNSEHLPEPVARLASFPAGHTEGWNTSFKNLFRAVYRTIRGHPEPGDEAFATLSDGHDRMVLVEAIVESSRSGRRVELATA
jgi:predicted dehydrogenase